MSILDSLSKKNSYWQQVAFKITGNKSLADDIVQNMYLKIYSANPTKWNYSYVVLTMYNLFKDYKKGCKYNLDIDDDKSGDVTIYDNYSYTNRELNILDEIDKLTEDEKELLFMNFDESLGKIALRKKVSRTTIHRHLSLIRKKILGDDLEGYDNKRLKWKK